MKIFCIGFHKTGTTSLGAALRQLGYRVKGATGVRDPEIGLNAGKLISTVVPEYDAFQDNPWPILFRELDRQYPGSRFILTMREPARWIRSQLGHFGSEETPMRRWIYGVGSPAGNEDVYLARYEAHNREVLSYFADRPADLLVMDLEKGDGWRELCGFLGHQVPTVPFPHESSAAAREKRRQKAGG